VRLKVFADADSAARAAGEFIAAEARAALETRGRLLLALSRTPLVMLRALSRETLPWNAVHVFQVDERVAPAADAARNLLRLREGLPETVLPTENIHAMPVESADLDAAAALYQRTLEQIAGAPAVLDLVHLGLGADGHTASLVPGDPVLSVTDKDVAVTREYKDMRRMTLTYPALDRARRILWLVTGDEKAGALRKLLKQDASIPAGRIPQQSALVLADRAAASALGEVAGK
jgi:6-phosphogluconolactonase